MTWMAELFRLTAYERLSSWLERISLPRAPLATGESRFSTRYLQRRFPGLQVRHIDVVPDLLFHGVQRRPQLQPVRFLYVAQLRRRKGGDLLVQALDRLRPELAFEVVVVGGADPVLVQALRGQTSSETWSRIQVHDHLTSAGLAEELSRATMLLCPTRADTGPMAVKEAVVAGVPVVGSDVGGVPDYVVPGENGLLFPSGSLTGFTDAIRAACGHSLFGRGAVVEGTLAALRARLAPARMAQEFLEAYDFLRAQRR